MRVNYSVENDSLYFYLSGELDEHYAKGAKDYIDKILDDSRGYNKVIFNLNELTFMDSTGIGMLLGRYKKLKKIGVAVYVENPTINVDKMMVLSGIYEVIQKI